MSALGFISLVLFCLWAPGLLFAVYLISPWRADSE
jgi:hypothetical protein